MIKQLKNLLSSVLMALAFTAPQMSQAMEVEEKTEKAVVLFPNTNLIQDLEGHILEIIVKDSCHAIGFAGHIGCVSKAWNIFFNEERYISPLDKNLKINLQKKCIFEIYPDFCKGELHYRPTLNRDKGMIILKISDLANPLKGTFDLSKCGDVREYLSISIGYRKGIIAENKDKVEIWFAPRAFIEQELKEGRATQFAAIFNDLNPEVQVVIFWTCGNDVNLNWFDYLVTSDNLTLTSKNLYKNWWSGKFTACEERGFTLQATISEKFHVHFK